MSSIIERIYYHGVPIDNLSPSQAENRVFSLIEGERTGNHIVTLTIPMYLEARRDPRFGEVLNQAALVIPESIGLRVASILHPPQLVRIPGVELASSLVEKCAAYGKKVTLFGSDEASRETAAVNLKTKHPSSNVNTVPGNYSFDDSKQTQEILEKLNRLAPDLAIMAGSQIEAESWINRWIVNQLSSVKVVGNFGQTIDVWSGRRNNYSLTRKLGFEWLLRIVIANPQRREADLHIMLTFGKLVLLDLLNQAIQQKEAY